MDKRLRYFAERKQVHLEDLVERIQFMTHYNIYGQMATKRILAVPDERIADEAEVLPARFMHHPDSHFSFRARNNFNATGSTSPRITQPPSIMATRGTNVMLPPLKGTKDAGPGVINLYQLATDASTDGDTVVPTAGKAPTAFPARKGQKDTDGTGGGGSDAKKVRANQGGLGGKALPMHAKPSAGVPHKRSITDVQITKLSQATEDVKNVKLTNQ